MIPYKHGACPHCNHELICPACEECPELSDAELEAPIVVEVPPAPPIATPVTIDVQVLARRLSEADERGLDLFKHATMDPTTDMVADESAIVYALEFLHALLDSRELSTQERAFGAEIQKHVRVMARQAAADYLKSRDTRRLSNPNVN